MIRFLILLLPLLFILEKGNAQELPSKKDTSSEYMKELLSFLTTVKKVELSDSAFTLADAPKFACFSYTVDDSVSFTNTELDQIANEIKFPKVTSWKTILPPSIRFLEENYLNKHSKVIKNPKREIKLFNKYFGGCYSNFSAPIFLKEYTFCLFYIDKICAAGKSSGELQVFEKRNGVWTQLTSRCEWTE